VLAKAISEALARSDAKYAITDRFDEAKGEYVGLRLAQLVTVDLNSDLVLVRREVADAQLVKQAPQVVPGSPRDASWTTTEQPAISVPPPTGTARAARPEAFLCQDRTRSQSSDAAGEHRRPIQTTADAVTSECFFDLRGAVQGADDHIKVWTKCLQMKDVEAVDVKKEFGGKIVENVADKLVKGYMPPIVAVEDATSGQFADVTTIEEIADVASIQPSARIFYELDCRGAMLRELSIEVVVDGRTGTKHSVSEWKYIAPETNGSRLKRMLCGK